MSKEELLKMVDEIDIPEEFQIKQVVKSFIENAYRIGFSNGMTEGAKMTAKVQEILLNKIIGAKGVTE